MRLSDGDNLQHGPRSGGYQILGVLAHGGTGVVYRALDTAVGREVAVKALHDRFDPESAAARQFVDAAQIMGQLQHPGIPPVLDVGSLPDGRPFLVRRLIRGRTVQELLDDRPEPAADRGRFVAVFEQVCQVVAYAHARGAIHRDLKPGHVMVGAFGEVQVIGWGSARVLGAPDADHPGPPEPGPAGGNRWEATVGTPAYLPPEQARGEVTDRRSDVFCLGGILCAMLTGHPPFVAGDVPEVLRMAASGDISRAAERLDGCGADPQLAAVARQCLSADPADRPADASAVAWLVASCRAAAEQRFREAEAGRVAAGVVAAEQRKRRRVQLALAVVVVLLIAACVALALARGGTGP